MYAKQLLIEAGLLGADDNGASWNRSPMLGALRAIWHKARAPVVSNMLSLPPPVPAAQLALATVPCAPASGLLSVSGAAVKMNPAERDRLKRAFEKSYPGVVLAPSVLPGLYFL